MGRAPLKSTLRRDQRLVVLLRKDEMEALKREGEKREQQSLSEWARNLLLAQLEDADE